MDYESKQTRITNAQGRLVFEGEAGFTDGAIKFIKGAEIAFNKQGLPVQIHIFSENLEKSAIIKIKYGYDNIAKSIKVSVLRENKEYGEIYKIKKENDKDGNTSEISVSVFGVTTVEKFAYRKSFGGTETCIDYENDDVFATIKLSKPDTRTLDIFKSIGAVYRSVIIKRGSSVALKSLSVDLFVKDIIAGKNRRHDDLIQNLKYVFGDDMNTDILKYVPKI